MWIKVLLALSDADESLRLKALLASHELDCDVAANSFELLEMVYHTTYRLILVDSELAGVGGFEACARLREFEWLAHVPVLMITADWEEETLLQVYQAGADDFLANPMHSAVLLEKARVWLERFQPPKSKDDGKGMLPPLENLTAGLLVGERYRVMEELDRGGMGVVHRAWDLRLGTDLAMKVISAKEWARGAEVQERFQREVAALARLRHPNIVRIYDTAKWDDFRYYTMEFLPGGTLRSLLAQGGALHILDALSIAETLGEAMQFTHDRGILHRDIKPPNILFSEANTPTLIDFGSMIDQDSQDTRLTPYGLALGTPNYMAPEQITTPEELDQRCDIYSLGAVLYEMLTGQIPFQGITEQQIVFKVVQEGFPSPRAAQPELPPQVEEICLLATAQKAEDRFPRAKDFARACRKARAELWSLHKHSSSIPAFSR